MGIIHRIVVLAGILLAGVAPPTGARLFSIRGIDDTSTDDATSHGEGRHLMAGTGDLLRQMHRMRHQDHKDEGLNLTRSMLAGRVSKMNNRTKARLIKVKKAAAPPKASVKPKKTKPPAAAAAHAPGAAPGPGAAELFDEDGDDFWTDDDFDDFNEDDYLEDLLKECAKDKAIVIFSCDAKDAEMCQLAVSNLEAMGVGHLAIASDEDVCDTLGYDDYCCTVAEDVIGAEHIEPTESMQNARWQYLEIALGFNYDVIMQDCDVLWTKNPIEDFRSDPEVGIIGLRERGTMFPFNAGLTWFRSDRAAVTRVVRDVNERVDFFSGVKDEPFRLEEIGIDEKCKEGDDYKKLYFDKSVYNDALESSALNDDVYTRSRMSCDSDNRDVNFNCVKGFPDTGCLLLEPEFGSGDGFANFKSRNGKTIKCSSDPDADINDAPAAASAAEESKTEEESNPTPTPTPDETPAAAEESTSSSDAAPTAEDEASSTPATSTEEEAPPSESAAESTERRLSSRRSHRRRLLANPRRLREFQLHRRAVLQDEQSSESDAASSKAAPSADEDVDFTEKPAKACVAADDILASWLWSEGKSGKEGAWSMKNPVALGYHFGSAPGGVAERMDLMKKVLQA